MGILEVLLCRDKLFFGLCHSFTSIYQLGIKLAYSLCLHIDPYLIDFRLLLVDFLLEAAIHIPQTRILVLLRPEQGLHFVDFVLLLEADFLKCLRQLEYALGKL